MQINNEYIIYVKKDLMDLYQLDEVEAMKMIRNSNFPEVIKESPNFVMHYNTEYWAERIYKKCFEW